MEQAVLQYEFAGAFFAELAKYVRSVVVSPGSRSTPLVLNAVGHPSASASGLEPIVVLDERSAGFVALGLAKASRQPVALVCTSGTAAANYLPAVVEAFHSRLPLVVITADRPASYHDWGSPQTIFQNGLYARHVRWATEVAVPRHSPAGAGRLTALRAVENACGPPGGPVHINWPLEKPLEPPDAATSAENREAKKQAELEKPLEPPDAATSAENREAKKQAELEKPLESPDAATLPAAETSDASWVDAELLGASQAASQATSQEMLPQNRRTERAQISREFLPPACLRGLIVVGHGNLSDAECAAVARFAEAAGWPIAAEASSGMRFGRWNSNVLVCAHFLFSNPSALSQPEVAIRVGGHHLDRALPRFLNTDSPQTRIVVAPPGCWDDPAFLADHFIHGDIAAIFNQAAEAIPDGATDSSISAGEAASDMAEAASIPDGAADSSIFAGEATGDRAEAEAIADGATDSSWLSEWQTADSAAAKALESALGSGSDSPDSTADANGVSKSLTEIEAVRILCETLCLAEPVEPTLYTSSSLPIRHLEYFAAPADKPLRVLANRGANGIDGIISSACGAALHDATLRNATLSDATHKAETKALSDATLSDAAHKADTVAFPTTTVLLGDLALLHDIGGLLTAAQLGVSLRLVVLNNNGGAIFSQLPIAEAVDADTFTKFFRTPHNLDLSFLGHLPGVRHIRPSTADELRSALSDCGEFASQKAGIAVIEVQTDAAEHMAEMKRCYEAVEASLSGI